MIMIMFKEWYTMFAEINLKKIFEEKLTNNSRVMNSIGRPIKIAKFGVVYVNDSKNSAKVKIFVKNIFFLHEN